MFTENLSCFDDKSKRIYWSLKSVKSVNPLVRNSRMLNNFDILRSINVYETIGQYSHEHRPNKHIHRFYEYGNKTDLDIFMVNWPLSVISILQHLLCSFSVFVLSSFRSSSIHFVRNILSKSKSRTIRDRFIHSALIIHTIFRIVRGINTSESDGKS